MPKASTRERLVQLHEREPGITQIEAARRLRATRQRVSQLAQEERLAFARKPVERGACGQCGRVRRLDSDRLCRACASLISVAEAVDRVDNMTPRSYLSKRRKVTT